MSLENFCIDLAQGKLDKEIAELQATTDHQLSFNHPLKRERAAKFNRLGENNAKILKIIAQLKDQILAGEDLAVD